MTFGRAAKIELDVTDLGVSDFCRIRDLGCNTNPFMKLASKFGASHASAAYGRPSRWLEIAGFRAADPN